MKSPLLLLIATAVCWVPALAGADAAQDALALAKMPILDVPQMEITVPEPPAVLHAGGRRSLCYEIYITSMFKKPFTIERVRVVADDGRILLESSGESLVAAMRSGKLAPTESDVLAIKGIERPVFFAWVDLPEGGPVPKAIRHEVSFKPEHGETLTIHTADVPVSDALRIIAPPLRGENWWADNGPSNTSFHRRAILAFDGTTYIGQRFAIDWLQVDRSSGEVCHGNASENANYYGYGSEVLAVADGVVSDVKDGIPENTAGSKTRAVPITMETVTGNDVILDIGGGLFAFYAHLQPGKIKVKVGDRVKVGDVLGLLGNSGNSGAPHLHFQLCNRNSALASQGVPYAFTQLAVIGQLTQKDDTQDDLNWFKAPKVRRNQMPFGQEIVSFTPLPGGKIGEADK